MRPPLTRRSGPLGVGGAYALGRLLASDTAAGVTFRPTARLREGTLLRAVASARMDTSDGAIATMDELMTLNGVGFRIESPVEAWTDPAALAAARAFDIPPWMLHAGPHGEFELVFSVPEGRAGDFRAAASASGWAPLELGTVTEQCDVRLVEHGTALALDAGRVRNLFEECGGDVACYVAELVALGGAGVTSGRRAS